jgi:hypothetical protein
MMLKNGSRGSDVTQLQKDLAAAGFDPGTIDGIYGPKTEAAVRQFQSANSLTVDGIAGPQTFGALTGASGGTADAVAGSSAGSDLLLPGSPQLWYNKETDEYWVVYTKPPVTLADGTSSSELYTSWRVESDDDLKAVIGPDATPSPAFVGDTAAFTEKGVIDLGGVDELVIQNLEGDPFDKWVEDMVKLATVKPWILDDDFQQIAVEAAMERPDGQVTIEEIQQTNWWKTHDASERVWMETYYSDPLTAERMLADNRDNLRRRLEQAGISNATDDVVSFMADKTTMGAWSNDHLETQIRALADPYSSDTIDDSLFNHMAGSGWDPDQTRAEEDTVRSLLHKWLGPVWGQWSDQDIAEKAGKLRNDPDAELELIESLKDQRMAMYPTYKDREMSYESIAQPWRSYTQGVWGVPVDDTDDAFQKVLTLNDMSEAGKVLRRTGLERGYERVMSDLLRGVTTGSTANTRGMA